MRVTMIMASVLALLVVVSDAAAQQRNDDVMDLEGLRDTLRMLIDNGSILTDNTMSGVATSYSGIVREYLDHLNSVLQDAKSPAEIYLISQMTDLQVTSVIMTKLQQIGKVSSQFAAAMHKLVEGPSSRMLQPYLTTSSGLSKISEMSSRALAISNSIGSLLKVAEENLEDQLKAHASSLPSGYVKSFMTDLSNTVLALQKVEIEADNFSDSKTQFSSADLQQFRSILDGAIDKQTVKYLIEQMTSKSNTIGTIDVLLTRDLSSQNLIDILVALRACLQ